LKDIQYDIEQNSTNLIYLFLQFFLCHSAGLHQNILVHFHHPLVFSVVCNHHSTKMLVFDIQVISFFLKKDATFSISLFNKLLLSELENS
jgi:hypothetical protein